MIWRSRVRWWRSCCGERLTPPPPPPPEVFTTAEVRRLRPEIVTADRKWDQIDADLQQRVLAIYEVMRRQYGLRNGADRGYRSRSGRPS
jgi:peptidoglycan L-alanyl-D-glutamate endopeptidase CwlK